MLTNLWVKAGWVLWDLPERHSDCELKVRPVELILSSFLSLSQTASSRPSWTSSWLESSLRMDTPGWRSVWPPPGLRSSSWPQGNRNYPSLTLCKVSELVLVPGLLTVADVTVSRTQNVLGEKGRRIRELTAVVQKRFGFPEGSVEVREQRSSILTLFLTYHVKGNQINICH